MSIEDRLDVTPKVNNLWNSGNGFDLTVWSLQSKQGAVAGISWRVGAIFMASHTSSDLSRLQGDETLHFLHRQALGIERDKEETAHGRDFQKGGTVRLNWHETKDAGNGEGPPEADAIKTWTVVKWRRQLL